MTVDELLERAAACKTCGKPHAYRRVSASQGTWAHPKDDHTYRPEIDSGTVAKLCFLATGVYVDPCALPPESGLKRVLARVFD
jgi:hypothetical protein